MNEYQRLQARAHYAVSQALAKGSLVKGPCATCGTKVKIEGHHPDYDRPLDVIWYCKLHHKAQHKKDPVWQGGKSLNIRDFPVSLHRELKAYAAINGKTVRELVISILWEGTAEQLGNRY